eukprot:1912065-Prymnesium_polylepis.1
MSLGDEPLAAAILRSPMETQLRSRSSHTSPKLVEMTVSTSATATRPRALAMTTTALAPDDVA